MKHLYALITGAGSGIGLAMARELALRGHDVLLVSKPGEDLEKASQQIEREYQVKSEFLEVDLVNDTEEVIRWIETNGFRINIMINNAGIGGSGPFASFSMDSYNQMIRINMITPVLLTRLLLDHLVQQEKAHIFFTGSISAALPMPYKAVYSSTKIFLKSFSMALRRELRHSTVFVSLGLPGPTLTNQRIQNEYNHRKRFIQKWGYNSPEYVAKTMIQGMLKGKYRIIPGKFAKMFYFMTKIWPETLNLYFFGKTFRRIST